jgi:hypothetical protein
MRGSLREVKGEVDSWHRRWRSEAHDAAAQSTESGGSGGSCRPVTGRKAKQRIRSAGPDGPKTLGPKAVLAS